MTDLKGRGACGALRGVMEPVDKQAGEDRESVSRTDQWMGECLLKNQNGIALYTLMKVTFLAYFPEQSPIRAGF